MRFRMLCTIAGAVLLPLAVQAQAGCQRDNAEDITVGAPAQQALIEGCLANGVYYRWYRFSVSRPLGVSITVRGSDKKYQQPGFQLLKDGAALLTRKGYNPTLGLGSEILAREERQLAPGTYHLRVADNSGKSEPLTLSVYRDVELDGFTRWQECGPSVTTITVPAIASPHAVPASQCFSYRLIVPERSEVTLKLGYASGFYPVLRLEEGDRVIRSVRGTYPSTEVSTHALLRPGSYYVVVDADVGRSVQLTATATPMNSCEKPIGAFPIGGGTVRGEVTNVACRFEGDPADMYGFQMNSPGHVTIELFDTSHAYEANSRSIFLWNPQTQSLVATTHHSGNEFEANIPGAGSYYLIVTAGRGGRYSVTLRTPDASAPVGPSLGSLAQSSPPPLDGQRWIDIGKDTVRTIAIDSTVVHQSGTEYTTWLKITSATMLPKDETTAGPWNRGLLLTKLDCANDRIMVLGMHSYSVTGARVGGESVKEPSWLPFFHDDAPLEEKTLRDACMVLRRRASKG